MASSASRSDLLGTKEAAELFAVRPQNFVRDWASRADFPPPVAVLAATRVWSRRDLETYRRAHTGQVRWPPRGRPKATAEAARWLPTIKRRLVGRFQPERIIVFGSQARGDARADSDLDLLVVMPDDRVAPDVVPEMRAALADVGVSKDVFVTSPRSVERYGTVVGTLVEAALREGVTVYVRA